MRKLSEEIPPLKDQITESILATEELAKKLNKNVHEIIPFLQMRELMIINTQLRAIHEHLDMIEERRGKQE